MLADDVRHMVRVPTLIEEIEVGSEIDAGVGYLVRVTDSDGAAEISLSYEDHDGQPATFARPAGTLLDRWVYAFEAQLQAVVDAAPEPSPELLARLEVLLRPAIDDWWRQRDEAAGARTDAA